jgi:hypothetical protein
MKNKNAQTRSKDHTGTIFFSICAAFFIGPWIIGSLIRMTTPQVTAPTPPIEKNSPWHPVEVADPDSEKQDYLKGMSEEEKIKALNALIYEPAEQPNRFLPNGAR